MWGLSGGKLLDRPTPDPAGPGQESVWDFPRPAVAEASNLNHRHLRIFHLISTRNRLIRHSFIALASWLTNRLITSVKLLHAKDNSM